MKKGPLIEDNVTIFIILSLMLYNELPVFV